VTLALDSQIAEHATSALSPVENDILNGTRFALAWRDDEVESFLDQTWIDGWLREAFTQLPTALKTALNATCSRRCAALNIRPTGSTC
jgi:hypothetical protein